MERNENGYVSLNLQELRIMSDLLCSECRKNINDLFTLWDTQRNENLERLQRLAEKPTEKEIERAIDEQIEKQIERSDD